MKRLNLKDIFTLNYALYFIAFLGIVGSIVMVIQDRKKPPVAQPIVQPSSSPYKNFIAGSGIIEAQTENINLGSLVAGVVENVYVQVGDNVKKGQPLFSLDKRPAIENLNTNIAALEVAKANLKQAEANLKNAKDLYANVTKLKNKGALTSEEILTRKNNVLINEAAYNVAVASIKNAEANVTSAKTTLELQTITAPIDCQVLQVNVRPGVYAATGQLTTPHMFLGGVTDYHVRVDIDENDAWRFKPGTKAVAYLRGDPSTQIPLQYVYYEPYVVPKINLTGATSERVDVRVLQAIYRYDPKGIPSYIGQQVDVYIEVPESENE